MNEYGNYINEYTEGSPLNFNCEVLTWKGETTTYRKMRELLAKDLKNAHDNDLTIHTNSCIGAMEKEFQAKFNMDIWEIDE